MTFTTNTLFHIYNQGNDKQPIFFSEQDYQFFLWKMRACLLSFGDLIAYCLMPNHFHWLFWVEQPQIRKEIFWQQMDRTEWQRRQLMYGKKAKSVERNTDRRNLDQDISLNNAIGILQRSYTRMINKQFGRTGSLFRQHCKAKDGWINEFVTLTKHQKNNYQFSTGNNYIYQCLHYIHENPKRARLVKNSTDWPYSSAKDYAGLRKGSLCNLEKGRKIIEEL